MSNTMKRACGVCSIMLCCFALCSETHLTAQTSKEDCLPQGGSLDQEIFPDLASAVSAIIDARDPQIISFGEWHAQPTVDPNVATTANRFSEVVQTLCANKYQYGILEAYPDSKGAQAEYQNLITINADITTKCTDVRIAKAFDNINYGTTPCIKRWQRSYVIDDTGWTKIIAACSLFGVHELHGSLAKETQAAYCRGEYTWQQMSLIINKGVGDKIAFYASRGMRVFTYTGSFHNNISDDTLNSFGKRFVRMENGAYGTPYLEVDIVVPRYLNNEGNRDLVAWLQARMPAYGVRVICNTTAPYSYTLICSAPCHGD